MTAGEPRLQPATLEWREGEPWSTDFGDVYFSSADGLAETRHVFLNHNGLPERFQTLAPGAAFVIGETGFGTGLNFLVTVAAWLEHAPTHAQLHYVSVEKFPLRPEDLRLALGRWPELAPLVDALLARYPVLVPGFHRLVFADWRVQLTLLLGDATTELAALDGRIDAWYLDGFAPSRNPELWQPALFQELARLSHAGTTFATFTVANAVRSGLSEAGFAVEKVPGCGQKREILTGRFTGQTAPAAETPPWFLPPSPQTQRQIAVIGAGIAGCAAARVLAERGFQVTVLDPHGPGRLTSGNPAAILFPKLPPAAEAHDHFQLHSYLYTLRRLHEPGFRDCFHDCGVLQLLDRRAPARERRDEANAWPTELVRLLTAEAASDHAKLPLDQDALHFPGAGWLEATRFCETLLSHPQITSIQAQVADLVRAGERWHLRNEAGESITVSSLVLLANALDALRLRPGLGPLQAVRGQITRLPVRPESAGLRTVLCGNSYFAPAHAGEHCVGATFQPNRTDLAEQAEDDAANIAELESCLPALNGLWNAADPAVTGRAGLRAQSLDYLPLIGGVPDQNWMQAHYAGLRDGKVRDYPPLQFEPGLYASIAHGSKGFTNAWLAAELLADLILGTPRPLPRATVSALHPARNAIRQLKRRQR